jgi:hypothetical protein
MIVPEQIPVACDVASRFRVSGDVTARDLSWSILLMHQAAELDGHGEVMLRDNATRHALGLSRRDRIEVEEQRWRRLRGCRINGRPAPTVRFERALDGTEWPWRHKEDDHIPVVVDEALLEQWQGDGYDTVFFPLRLLQQAKSAYSIIMMLRALAWSTGDYSKRVLVRRDGRSVTLRHSLADWADMMGVTSKTWHRRLVDEILIPAAEEITEITDWTVSITPRVAHTGRIRDVEITIVDPVEDPASDTRAIEARGENWRPRSRPSMRRPKVETQAPAKPVHVSQAALDAAAPLSVKSSPDSGTGFMRRRPNASNTTQSKDTLLDPSWQDAEDLDIEF